MLDMRSSCEHCAKTLPMETEEALICSYECTYCTECAAGPLQGRCSYCQGELLRRPRRIPKDPSD